MINKKRVAIYIDGSNFYFKLRSPQLDLKNLSKFDFQGFAKFLARDRIIISRRYYIGVVRAKENNKKGQGLRKEQQRLFAYLQSPEQNFIIKKGYLMENDGVYHEKGVDVNLAIDLLTGAYDDLYDSAILVSSDTDLIPAIKKVRFLEKEVEYIGFAHQPSFGMQRFATLSRLLIREDIERFANNTLL